MQKYKENLIEIIKSKNLTHYLNKCNFGLEKENLRVNLDGTLALTKHPKKFGDKWNNPYIKTDFSESQIEMVTPACDSINEVYEFMGALNDIVSIELKDEVLWPQSNPPIIPDEDLIPVADFNGTEAETYRKYLATKYSKKRQLLSGIHFNFSFKDDFIKLLFEESKEFNSLKDFKNNLYLNLSRNFFKYEWLLNYLTGASPVFHDTYIEKCVNSAEKFGPNSVYFNHVNSLRTSRCGYKNKEDFFVSYNSLEEYVSDLRNIIADGVLYNEKEYYSHIRLKNPKDNQDLDSLLNNGIEYLEFRFLDLNPLTEFGVSLKTLKLLHGFIIYMAFKNSNNISKDNFERNLHEINSMQRQEIKDFNEGINNKNSEFKNKAINLLNEVEELLKSLNILTEDYSLVFEEAKKMILNPENLPANKIKEKIKNSNFIDFHLEVANKSLELSKSRPFALRGFEDLELSTQILVRDAIKRGISFDILDRAENFIELSFNGKKEYVKQATKTSVDSYITALVMENKEVTKTVLKRNDVRVPKGNHYVNREEALGDFELYKDKPIVIKPKTTNFGLGISIFKNKYSLKDFSKAVDIAFSEDKSILIEEFIPGKEYRFLVIDDEVVGILHRVPANVTGDGTSNIRQLVELKNQDPLRGKGYVKPLEKIKLGELEALFLKNQGLDFDYIPKKSETVYLRENSNISTGGDSLDFTDEMHQSYKDIAINAAKALNAKITGIDIMLQDISEPATEDNYGIIELNFNPAIHIHCFPYKGKNRKAGEKVLNLLFDSNN